MTKATLRRLTRSYVADMGGDWLKTTTSDPTEAFGIDDYLELAVTHYAHKTLAFPVSYAKLAVVDQPIYPLRAFGVEAASVEELSVYDTANDTAVFTLVADKPSNTYIGAHYISVTLKNATGAPLSGNAASYTVAGTDAAGADVSEDVAFAVSELASLAAGGIVTHTTRERFATVSSITPSAAQPAGYQHAAGIGAQSAGARMLGITAVAYDGTGLYEITSARLDSDYSNWRFAASGVPVHWFRHGGRQFRVYPAPSGTSALTVDGYETPDLTAWTAETEPPLDVMDHELLAVRAAYLVIMRNPTPENITRAQGLVPLWDEGVASATQRIHGANGADVVVGLRAQLGLERYPESARTIQRV